MKKQKFYQGQRVMPIDLNEGLSNYSDSLIARLQADTMGAGVITGFTATHEGGLALGIAPGLGYNAQGRRLVLENGRQLNLAEQAPTVGTMWTKVWAVLAYTESAPVLDTDGNTVNTLLVETTNFAAGDTVPEGALHLYDVELSSGSILLIRPAFNKLETPKGLSLRTQGYTWNEGLPKITAPNGFEVDLLTLATRRAVFDPNKPGGYKIGDIIWLEPPTYDTQQTPPKTSARGEGGVIDSHTITYPYTRTNFMGKEITYSEPTHYREYAVRLRALVENPRNPAEHLEDWAVDSPSEIVEEGSNSNGGYSLWAGGKCIQDSQRQHIGMVINTRHIVRLVFPMIFKIIDKVFYAMYENYPHNKEYFGSHVNIPEMFFDNLITSSVDSVMSAQSFINVGGIRHVRVSGTWY